MKEVDLDPVHGERTVELSNIRREEPDPELFITPAGFQIMEQPLVMAKPQRPAATP